MSGIAPSRSRNSRNPLSPITAEMENRRSLTVRSGSDALGSAGRSARKRTSDIGIEGSSSRRRTREPSPEGNDVGDVDEYDPDQSMQERRAIQGRLRDIQKQMRENPDEFLQEDPTALLDYLNQADSIIKNVKQTAEAAIDARGLVIAADLSARRAQRLTSGNVGNGVDVDEFVSKCITYMLQGRGIEDDEADELSSTQRRRRQPDNRGAMGSDDEDEAGDDGDMMNWAHLGRFACNPAVRRPALPGFLLGPLSIEKKVRKVTKRSAPFRVNNLREVRPQELRAEDLRRSDKNDLPSICKKIHVQLVAKQEESQNAVENVYDKLGDMSAEDDRVLLDRWALRANGGIDLLRFVINPRSFGQTVENMFYVSFLIREGSIQLGFDENGLPSIEPVQKDSSTAGVSRAKTPQRHQAIMSIDMAAWRDIIDAFDIKEPMIPHREEEEQQGPGARGWYS